MVFIGGPNEVRVTIDFGLPRDILRLFVAISVP